MNKISILLLSSMLFLGGCTIGGEEEDFSQDIPPIPPAEQPEDNQAEEVEEPIIVGTANGIIPSTDPEARLRQIEDGRSDPFALPTVPRVTIQQIVTPEGTTENGVNGTAGTNGAGVNPGGTAGADGTAGTNGANVTPGTVLPDGTVVPPGALGP
ncbi:hypothetical protein IQ215_13775, partial [Cyanobacterium stanieri LEGE 03274]|nr:hypothetical protein [Cyanobacterium stanieri LEGE 03274]